MSGHKPNPPGAAMSTNAAQLADASTPLTRPRGNRQTRRAHLQRIQTSIARTELQALLVVAEAPNAGARSVELPPLAPSNPVHPSERSSGIAPSASVPHTEPLGVEQLALLDLYGQAPVSYDRVFVDICDGINAAVWLSHALGLHRGLPPTSDGWFLNDQRECSRLLGLSVKEYATARARVTAKGFVESRRFGARVQFKLNTQVIARALIDQARKTWAQAEAAMQQRDGKPGKPARSA